MNIEGFPAAEHPAQCVESFRAVLDALNYQARIVARIEDELRNNPSQPLAVRAVRETHAPALKVAMDKANARLVEWIKTV